MVLEPTWQNFSSMYREAVVAQEAATGMEISHHRTSALYFGISSLECFLNREMTRHCRRQDIDDDVIFERVRKPKFRDKIRRWPGEITGKELSLGSGSLDRLMAAYDLRSDLTHLKNYWPEAFESLGDVDPLEFVALVAEYIIAFHVAKNELFPYWLYGWNYLSPVRDGYQIVLMPTTQFIHSLRYLGYTFKTGPTADFKAREAEVLGDFSSFQQVTSYLSTCGRCEPKVEHFTHQPKLCAKWWDASHQRSCGAATPAALARSIELDEAYAAKRFLGRRRGSTPSHAPIPDNAPLEPRMSKLWPLSLAKWRLKWPGRR
jgi:hypothetical protein